MKPKEVCTMLCVQFVIWFVITVLYMVVEPLRSHVPWQLGIHEYFYFILLIFKKITIFFSFLCCSKEADKIKTIEQYAFRAFADALEAVPLALAENSGLDPINTLTEIKASQVAQNNAALGVNCNDRSTNGKTFII